jgi:hypothetical protein
VDSFSGLRRLFALFPLEASPEGLTLTGFDGSFLSR